MIAFNCRRIRRTPGLAPITRGVVPAGCRKSRVEVGSVILAGNKDSLALLIDVDNTLLDNDRFGADLDNYLQQAFGARLRERYREIYEQLRDEAGYADYLGALQRFRADVVHQEGDDHPALLHVAEFMLEYPFAQRVYPHALETLSYLRTLAGVTIVSDGDIVFQPRKIQRSGIYQAVDGRVLIYLHKQKRLDAIERHCRSEHYVMVDDKPQVLADMKRQWRDRLTTVFVRQGHYAVDAAQQRVDPAPDRSIERIDDLRDFTRADFLPTSGMLR